MKTTIEKLNSLGQSAWLDNINRSMLKSGAIKSLVSKGLRGMTSNPTIFEKAITGSEIYDKDIEHLSRKGASAFNIYDELTVRDIQDACDIFMPVHEATNRLDGYVSLEINPELAFDQHETIEEGKRLYKKVNRPNLMLKVPATHEGFGAIEELTSLGMNINSTLIFSLEQYISTANSYINGVKRLMEKGMDAGGLRSVASVFVSRIDTAIDKELEERSSLKGKAAAANCAVIYNKYQDIFYGEEFKEAANNGANAQRVLWASTSTKDPAYSDIKYVSELIAKDTVNTLPDNTFNNFLDHGNVIEPQNFNIENARKVLHSLAALDIDINQVTSRLLNDGIIAFQRSFKELIETLNNKKRALIASR